ncbi:MAG: hypothetical protein WKG00_34470 [Polyangiaceae bacterium]
MGHNPEHSATMYIPPDVYERMRNAPRADDAPAPSVIARVTRPRYDGEEGTLASQRDFQGPAPQAAVDEPSMEVDPRELLDASVFAAHAGVPVTANGTLLMEAVPCLVGQREQTHVQRRYAAGPQPEAGNPDSARVRRELDEMSMVFETHAISRRLATASDDEMAHYLDSLRASQGLPPQTELGAPPPPPAHWQIAPAAVREDVAQARFDPIAQRFAPPAGFAGEPTQAPQSAFAIPRSPAAHPAQYAPTAYAPQPQAPAYAPQSQATYVPQSQPPAYPPHPQSQAPAAAFAQHAQAAYGAPYAAPGAFAQQQGAPGSPFALPPSQLRPGLASPHPPSQMIPSAMLVPSPGPKRNASTAMLAVMFVVALVGVGAVTYVALRSGPHGAVTGPLSSLRVADAA